MPSCRQGVWCYCAVRTQLVARVWTRSSVRPANDNPRRRSATDHALRAQGATLVSHGWTGPTRVDVCEALGMTQVDYEVRGLEAHRFDLGDGEFLRVELYDGYFSIAWSTPLPIGAILRQVRLLLRDAHGDAVLYDAASQAYEDLPADEAITRALAHDASLLLLRLELSDVTLVWKHAAESAPRESGFGQLALLAGRFDEDLCVRVVRQTATPAVAQHSAELIQRASYVADHVGQGLLRSALGDAGP